MATDAVASFGGAEAASLQRSRVEYASIEPASNSQKRVMGE
jgi:hypothetical protein